MLLCWVIDTPTKQIFSVEIACDKLWGSVKDVIKKQKEPEFNDIDADTYSWLVDIEDHSIFLQVLDELTSNPTTHYILNKTIRYRRS